MFIKNHNEKYVFAYESIMNKVRITIRRNQQKQQLKSRIYNAKLKLYHLLDYNTYLISSKFEV
jgi:hypothetical protein